MRFLSKRFIGLFAAVLFGSPSLAAGCASDASSEGDQGEDELRGATSMVALLATIPPGTKWQDVKPAAKRRLQANADAFYRKLRHDWGERGLDEKEARLLSAPSPSMIENFDRIIKFLISPEIPDTFVPSRDITNPELLEQMKRFYLVYCAKTRAQMTTTNPDFKDWDGGDLKDYNIREPVIVEAQKAYAEDVERAIRAIPATSMTDVENAIVRKALFRTRDMRQGYLAMAEEAGYLYSAVVRYKPTPKFRIFDDDDSFLLAINAQTFLPAHHWVNVATVDTFNWDLDSVIDTAFMTKAGLDPTTAAGKGYLALAGWWRERVSALPDATKKCTIYTKAERDELWDDFTAGQYSNADGSESFPWYQQQYRSITGKRIAALKATATDAVERAFPGTTVLTAAQKAQVNAAIANEARPGALLATINGALDAATGATAASTAFKAQLSGLTKIGGGYAASDPVRPADTAALDAMWADVKAFYARHYGGRTVDIASLLPATLVYTTGTTATTGSTGIITVGLGSARTKATWYSTLLHESKHAIDYASHVPVQGAAWEGAALMAEETVGPAFLDEVMSAEAAKLPFYRLDMALGKTVLYATTDATIQVFLRPSCSGPNDPSSIDFAKDIVRGYGITDDATLLLRSRRAHWGSQFLQYEYGNVQYGDLVSWLQQQVGPTVKVDPYLLQACAMPSPNKDAAAVAKLEACVGL